MKVFFVPIFILLLGCAGSTKIKRTNTTNDVSINSKHKCPKPPKQYAKDLTAKIEAEMDSLNHIPKSELEASLKTTTVKLAQFSSEGLDQALYLYYMCNLIKNNIDIPADDRYQLLNNMTTIFDKEVESVKKKNQE